MKKLYTILAFFGAAFWCQAQVTISSTTFPAAGDTLKTATDLNPDGVTITNSGGPFTWDFTGLAPTVKQETVFQAATEGSAFAEFSDAELVTIGASGQGETYFDVSANSFSNLGFYGTDPTGALPIPTAFKFSPPVPERRAPLNFIDNFLAETSLNITLPIDSTLAAILGQLGLPTGLADSLRIRLTASRYELVDAYGTLAIPGGTYDVLREKSTEYRDTHLDIHTILGWIDVTAQAGAGTGLGQDTTITYNFISNTEKEYIAEVQVSPSDSTIQQVRYKDNGVISGNKEVLETRPEVLVSPNPFVGQTIFELKNYAPGDYSLRLLDVSGRQVFTQDMVVGSNAVNLDALGSGAYFYQIINPKAQVLNTGKVFKIND